MGRSIVVIWLAAELLAYAAFFAFFPVLAGLAIGVGSIALGVMLLAILGRRLKQADPAKLIMAVKDGRFSSIPRMLLAALLLLMPGFLSNLAGAFLAVTSLGSLLKPEPRKQASLDIELSRDEWTRLPDDDGRR